MTLITLLVTQTSRSSAFTRGASFIPAVIRTSNTFSYTFPRKPSIYQAIRMFGSSSSMVNETFDTALDGIMGNLGQTKKPNPPNNVMSMQDPKVLGEMTGKQTKPEQRELKLSPPLDIKNPAVLSITNPHWIQSGMHPTIIDILSHKGYSQFTPVQAEAFLPILSGRHVIGRSRTGTGKTLAYGLPCFHRLVELREQKDANRRRRQGRNTSMLILCPTRELSRQVEEELREIAHPLALVTSVFHGGVSYEPQNRSLRQGIDVLVGTPGRIMDHLDRGTLNLQDCDIVVLDEADEMLNMGFADDVDYILQGIGESNPQKTQCLLFSATTPSWVNDIARKYQDQNVLSIDTTSNKEARTATSVRHIAIQVPPGIDSKKAILEDIIAMEISKDVVDDAKAQEGEKELSNNPIAHAVMNDKKKSISAIQQKIFGKTIVFTETKKDADDLVSGNVFKSLTAQALHGDVGQKQRDATLKAFRAGAFNVLVATDVAARGIDIKNVDLVIQFAPPRDNDTYVHRSGRTGRAGEKGTSVLLFDPRQAKDIVRIERSIGHGFRFEIAGPPSIEAALIAAAKTSAIACRSVPEETANYFLDAASSLLAEAKDRPEKVVAKCLAAISRRSTISLKNRSLLTGETGMTTIEMSKSDGKSVSPNDVMFTVSKLANMSSVDTGVALFDSDIGKIQANHETGVAVFDMSVNDAEKLIEFSHVIHAKGVHFRVLKELEIERGKNFGMLDHRGSRRSGGRSSQRGYQNDRGNKGGRNNQKRQWDDGYHRDYNRSNRYHAKSRSTYRGEGKRDKWDGDKRGW